MILRALGVSFLASYFHAGSFPMSILITACPRHQPTSQHAAQASNSVCTFFFLLPDHFVVSLLTLHCTQRLLQRLREASSAVVLLRPCKAHQVLLGNAFWFLSYGAKWCFHGCQLVVSAHTSCAHALVNQAQAEK